MSLADQVEAYVSVLLRWGAEVAFGGVDTSKWWDVNN